MRRLRRFFSANRQRPVACVPNAVTAVLAATLVLHGVLQAFSHGDHRRPTDLAPAPAEAVLRLASLGDPIPTAKLLSLHLQSFDYGGANTASYKEFDYGNLAGWLSRILSLDPAGQYPLMLAARLYAEVPDAQKQRFMMDWVYRSFFADPGRRWPWLAHVSAVAKHRLGDLPLARKYAAAIQQHAVSDDVPLWARQMEAFILEDMNELEAARIMIGGFIEKGLVKHPGELRFLEQRLKEIEARLGESK